MQLQREGTTGSIAAALTRHSRQHSQLRSQGTTYWVPVALFCAMRHHPQLLRQGMQILKLLSGLERDRIWAASGPSCIIKEQCLLHCGSSWAAADAEIGSTCSLAVQLHCFWPTSATCMRRSRPCTSRHSSATRSLLAAVCTAQQPVFRWLLSVLYEHSKPPSGSCCLQSPVFAAQRPSYWYRFAVCTALCSPASCPPIAAISQFCAAQRPAFW